MAAKLSSFWGNWMSPPWPWLALSWSLSCPGKRSPSFPCVEAIAWLGFHFRHLPWAFFLMSPNVGHDHRLIQYQNLLDFLNKLLLKCKTGGIFPVKGPRPCWWKALRQINTKKFGLVAQTMWGKDSQSCACWRFGGKLPDFSGVLDKRGS